MKLSHHRSTCTSGRPTCLSMHAGMMALYILELFQLTIAATAAILALMS